MTAAAPSPTTLRDALVGIQAASRIWPHVALDHAHRARLRCDGAAAPVAPLEAALVRYDAAADPVTFAVLFDALKEVDGALDGNRPEDHLFDDGLLIVGRCTWEAFSLVPGEYPFRNLRYVPLRPSEVEAYRRTPRIEFPDRDRVVVASCPLGGTRGVRFEGHDDLGDGQYGLVWVGLRDPETRAQEVRDCLDWARAEGANVVLFPELCVDRAGHRIIEGWLTDQVGTGASLPQIIVAGSHYSRGEDGRFRNRAPVYLVPSDATSDAPFVLVHYDKHVPFSMTVPPDSTSVADPVLRAMFEDARSRGCSVVVEDIAAGDAVTLIPTSAGLFGLCICRDALDLAGMGNPMQRTLDVVDFQLIVSFNSGATELFDAVGEDFARWHNCAVVYNNARQAIHGEAQASTVRLGFCIYPYDRAGSAMQGEIVYVDPPVARFGGLSVRGWQRGPGITHEISLVA